MEMRNGFVYVQVRKLAISQIPVSLTLSLSIFPHVSPSPNLLVVALFAVLHLHTATTPNLCATTP